jgi:mono/diheme cytochrome c family protein
MQRGNFCETWTPKESTTLRTEAKHQKSRYLSLALCLILFSCRQQMAEQPRYEPLAKSEFFGDDRSARPQLEGTVAQGQLQADEHFYSGKIDGKPADAFPFTVTAEMLRRGRERFDIFCSPCHDRVGNGQGMIVRRGFRPPPSLHIDRLRKVPPGHLYEVISQGFGSMPGYAEQVPPADRWAMAAYVRALQLSQQATLTEVPQKERERLQGTKR